MHPSPYFPHPVARLRRGVGGLGTAVSILLGLDAAVLLAKTAAFAWRYSLATKLERDPFAATPKTILTSDGFVSLMSGLHVLLCLALFVVFICWFAAARTNAGVYAPEPGRLTLPRGWAVGGWFVPLGNCVLPFLVARDIYRGTMDGRSRKPGSGGVVTGVWWSLLITGSVLGLAAVAAGGKHTKLAGLQSLHAVKSSTALYCVGNPVLVAAAVAGLVYVQTLTSAQRQRNAAFQPPAYGPGYAYGYGYPAGPGMPPYPPGPGPAPVTCPPQTPSSGPQPIPVPDYVPVTAGVAAPTQDIPTDSSDAQSTSAVSVSSSTTSA